MADQRLWHETEILAALATGATLVASSERLARAIRLSYAHGRRDGGEQAWERPEVLTWSGFLHSLVARCEEAALGSPADTPPRQLNASQSEGLWETVIGDSAASIGLLQPAATAREAAAAWEACCAFHISLDDCESAAASDDARQFASWSREFLRRCEQHGLLDASRLPPYLADQIAAGLPGCPRRLVLTGFDAFTPQQEGLLAAITASGSEVTRLAMESAATPAARRVSCADETMEMRAAADWARTVLEREPRARIGIVVQDLAHQCLALARILDESLCPGVRQGEKLPRPYNLSFGQPLSECPAVHDALVLLGSGLKRLPFSTSSLLLRSPFFAAAEAEQSARTRLELRLRGSGGQSMALSQLSAVAREVGAMDLAAKLGDCLKVLSGVPASQPLSGWAVTLSALLKSLGWPGARTPDTREFQALTVFHEVLSELAGLDTVFGSRTLNAAVTHLHQLARQRTFQPAGAEVPVQVLGMPETIGLKFDYLWIMGLSHHAWPASSRPNPLIPWILQRQLPRATAARA